MAASAVVGAATRRGPDRPVRCIALRSPVVVAVHERALFDYLTLALSPAFPGNSLVAVEIARTVGGKALVMPRGFGFDDNRAIAA